MKTWRAGPESMIMAPALPTFDRYVPESVRMSGKILSS